MYSGTGDWAGVAMNLGFTNDTAALGAVVSLQKINKIQRRS